MPFQPRSRFSPDGLLFPFSPFAFPFFPLIPANPIQPPRTPTRLAGEARKPTSALAPPPRPSLLQAGGRALNSPSEVLLPPSLPQK